MVWPADLLTAMEVYKGDNVPKAQRVEMEGCINEELVE